MDASVQDKSSNSTCLISIIVPIWNAELHLPTLLEVLKSQCVLQQDASLESDAEVIFVDDGSTDNSAQLIKKYQQEFLNIAYIYQENAGQTCARNTGIEMARGEYIYMMDQDDVVVPNTILPFTQLAKDKGADILVFRPKIKKPCKIEDWKSLKQTPAKVLCAVKGVEFIEAKNGFIPSEGDVWTKIYNRTFLNKNKVRFVEYKLYFEDAIFNWAAMIEASNVLVLDNVGYWWITYPTSDSHTSNLERRKTKHLNGFKSSQIMMQFSDRLKRDNPQALGVYQLAKSISYVFQFLPFAFILKNRAVDYHTSIEMLDVCKRNKTYPMGHIMPQIIEYPKSAKLLYFLISWEPILRLLLYVRCPHKKTKTK